MGAFTTIPMNPLELKLDVKNPRFIVPQVNAKESDIIQYLCDNEDAIKLCNRLNNIGTILPGERIVVCEENGQYVVLEGNRRVCCCKMLLNPSNVPDNHKNKIKTISSETRLNISIIEVDVIASREIAKKYLAARHINGVKNWSTIAKMNFVSEEFANGNTLENIAEITSLSMTEIRKHLRNDSLIKYGILAGKWTKDESECLQLTKIEPDKYLRIFSSGAKNILKMYFDNSFIPHSTCFSDKDLYTILARFIRGAFIDESIDTRNMSFARPDGNLYKQIEDIIKKYDNANTDDSNQKNENKEEASQEKNPEAKGNNDEKKEYSYSYDQTNSHENQANKSNTKNLPLFGALNTSAIDNKNHKNRGIIFITNEIIRFSKYPLNLKNYPIAAAMLTRCLIENTLVYYLQQRNEYDKLLRRFDYKSSNIKLSDIVKYYIKSESNLFDTNSDNVKSRFNKLFKDYNDTANPLNWVVHQLNAFKLSAETLQTMVDEGLFDVIQYMLLYKQEINQDAAIS